MATAQVGSKTLESYNPESFINKNIMGNYVASAIYPLPLYVYLKSNCLAIIILDLLKDPGLESS